MGGSSGISRSAFTPEYQTFLAQIRRLRESQKLSQRELGRRLGRHSNFVSSVEMGDRVLAYTEARAWCRALGTNWVEFTRQLEEILAAQEAEATASHKTGHETNAAPGNE